MTQEENIAAVALKLKELALARRATVGTAESCTGGLIAAAITAVPGSSEYCLGGVVSYANSVKAKLLGVPEEILGTVGAVGSLVRFNTEGLEFVMTAMFVVIFTEQWLKEKSRLTALIGLASSALCLFCFGPDSFMIPSMLVIFALLALWRRPIIHRGGYEE